MYQNQETGKLGENIAFNYLANKGYDILEKNFSCKFGEIDIIMQSKNNDDVIFVEVKTRTQTYYGNPIDSITKNKLRHLYQAANYFLTKHHLENSSIRFDVVEILQNKLINNKHLTAKIRHLEDILFDSPEALAS